MKNGRFFTLAPSFFSPLQQFSSVPDYISSTTTVPLSLSLQHYINSENPSHGQKIHSHILKSGFRPNTNISIKLLILFLKGGCLRYARQVFDALPQQTLSAYNYLIGGYLKKKKVNEVIFLVRKLIDSGQKRDGYTFSMLLKASTCIENAALPRNFARSVHSQIIKSEIGNDDVLYTALVDSYIKSGKLGSARTVFDTMQEKNVICSTSMISGYMNRCLFEDAEEIFIKTVKQDIVVFNAMIEGYSRSMEYAEKSLEVYIDMQRLSFRPNISTFASVIGACSVLTSFDTSRQVHCQLMKFEFCFNVKMSSAVLDMYSKCGRVEDARRVFNYMEDKNVFSWTSMIDGYGKNGHPFEALDLFDAMKKESRVEPNYVTFLGALSTCGHAGLVEKGEEIFESMEKEYRLKPQMEHYACMVDLLGRSGNLKKAWEFVMEMPEKPNSDVWAALLSSCTIHGDTEMARAAASELFKLNANDRPGAYVALSNTMAAAEKWESVIELREIMKGRGVSKDSGSSWV